MEFKVVARACWQFFMPRGAQRGLLATRSMKLCPTSTEIGLAGDF